MSKKMTFRKKGLAVILCLMMGIATIAGCGKQEETPVVEEDEDALEVPEVKGKEETVGAFTLLVPKGMEAEEGSSESVVTLSDDDDANIVFQVVDKGDAKDYVKALKEEDDSFEDVSFSLDGTKWTGAAYKKDFVVYAKIGKATVLAIGTGYKYTDDIPLAVLASLEVEDGAETVAISGASSGKGGTFVYGDGLYTVQYSGDYREADPSSEFGDLVSADGKQKVYITAVSDWSGLDDLENEIMYYDYELEEFTVDGKDAYLFTYEDYFGDITANFVIPLDYVYSNQSQQMVAVQIYTSGSTVEEAASDAFLELVKSVDIDDEACTYEGPGSSSGTVSGDWAEYWERGWYGFWIVSDACSDYESNIGYAYDCLATFECDGDEVHMQVVDAKSDKGTLDVDVYFDHYTDNTVSGWLISNDGQILGYDIGYYDTYIDPESDSELLDDYISMYVSLYDTDGTWVLDISFFLRPWGADFSDFDYVDEADLPYMCVNWTPVHADMYPFNYDSWYVNIMDDPFPGLDAIIGQTVD